MATTVSSDDIEYVKELGADEIVDYSTQAFETILKDYDAVFDTVGGEVLSRSLDAVRPFGRIASIIRVPANLEKAFLKKDWVKFLILFWAICIN